MTVRPNPGRNVPDSVVPFPDHFSQLADAYARFRPSYPPELFERIAAHAPNTARCWDCATGSGQAAVSLATHFRQVVATDASAEQIAHATAHERVEYRVEPAERTSLEDQSVDAVTIAAALHWLDTDAFFAEVARVTRPGGLFAAWTYTTEITVDPAVTEVIERYNSEVLRDFWTPQHQLVWQQYRPIAMPFEEIEAPKVSIWARWTCEHLLGTLDTWSSAGLYREANGHPPSDAIRSEMQAAWARSGPLEEPRTIELPLAMRWGRVS